MLLHPPYSLCVPLLPRLDGVAFEDCDRLTVFQTSTLSRFTLFVRLACMPHLQTLLIASAPRLDGVGFEVGSRLIERISYGEKALKRKPEVCAQKYELNDLQTSSLLS